MKRSWKIILLAIGVYILLLAALVAVESGAPEASIRSFWDAVWFSLITMTTVGYGDLSPVTAAGRVLGMVFALCSIGILTALIGIGLNLLGGQIIPALRLRLARARHWYVFREESEDAVVLARALLREDPGALAIFPVSEPRRVTGSGIVRMDADPARLRTLRGGQTEGCALFYLGEDGWANYAKALADAQTGFALYCLTEARADDTPEQLHLFGRTEALSRCYWKEHPLRRDERTVVLLGCGKVGSALLERAILTNVIPDGARVEYHIFDDSASFAQLHGEVCRAMAPGDPDEDRLIFHTEDWHEATALLSRADRIILAWDEDAKNLEVYEQLHTWFALPGAIHLRLSDTLPQLPSFGEREAVITPEFVMNNAINRFAVTINDLYNADSDHPVEWRDLGWFLRESNIAAADHLIVKIRYLLRDDTLTEINTELCRRAAEKLDQADPDVLQETEHRRWMRFHWLYNWQHAETRDNTRRLHPLLIPYRELDETEKHKDIYAWELLRQLSLVR